MLSEQHNLLYIVKMIMNRRPIQEVLDAAEDLLDATIVICEGLLNILAVSKTKDVHDPFWKRAFELGYADKSFFSNVYESDYMKSLPHTIDRGTLYAPDNVTLKFWAQGGVINDQSYVCAVALPRKDESFIEEKRLDTLQSLAWMIYSCYFRYDEDSILPLKTNASDLLYTLDETLLRHGENISYEKKNSYSDVQLVIIKPQFPNVTSTMSIVHMYNLQLLFGSDCATIYNGNAVALTPPLTDAQFKALEDMAGRFDLRIGLSWVFSGKHNVKEAYRQATAAVDLACRLKCSEPVCSFDRYFIFDILEKCPDKIVFQEFKIPSIIKLQEHDAQHNSQLYDTLYCYLRNGMRLMSASRDLDIHKSTLQHRIETISDIIDLDLSDADNRLALLMAFNINRLRKH